MSSFSLAVHFLKNCSVVRLPDEMDLTNADKVDHVLTGVLSMDGGIIADMTATTFCDAAGVRAVLRARDRAEQRGYWLRAVIPNRGVRRVFALTGADSQVRIYPSIDQALPGGQERTAPGRSAPGPRGRLIPGQPRYPELPVSRGPGEPAGRGETSGRHPGSAGAFAALAGEPGGQAAPAGGPSPAGRAGDLTTRLRSEYEQSLVRRARMSALWARLAATCVEVAATHERLARHRPQSAARHLSVSQAARDHAVKFQRLAREHAV